MGCCCTFDFVWVNFHLHICTAKIGLDNCHINEHNRRILFVKLYKDEQRLIMLTFKDYTELKLFFFLFINIDTLARGSWCVFNEEVWRMDGYSLYTH